MGKNIPSFIMKNSFCSNCKIKLMHKSIHNQLYLLNSGEKSFVVRIPSKKRYYYNSILKKVSGSFGPKIVERNKEPYFHVEEFIDGKIFEKNNKNIRLLAKKLFELHTLEFRKFEFNPFNYLKTLSRKVRRKRSKHYCEYKRILNKFLLNEERYNSFLKKNGCSCIIHRDLRPRNILVDNKEVKIIDWDFGKYGDPAEDIAALFITSNFDVKEKCLFFKNYNYKTFGKYFEKRVLIYIYMNLLNSIYYHLKWYFEKKEKNKNHLYSIKSNLGFLDKFI